MPFTITEKILGAHSSTGEIRAGEFANCRVDLVLGNDVTTPAALKEFKKIGAKSVFDKEKIVIVPDHFTPNKDIKSAEQARAVRLFAKEQGLVHYFEVGRMGIEHVLLPDQGLIAPGELIIGADSHTCTYGALGAFATGVGSTDMACAMAIGEVWLRVPETLKFIYFGKRRPWVSGKDLILRTIAHIGVDGALYKAMEFTGEAIADLQMSDRFTMANMAIEAGAKNGIFEPDEKTLEYLKGRVKREFEIVRSDPDASYADIFEFDVGTIEPQVAFPHLPENSKPISEVGNIPIDQAVIGSCTNGRLEDLRIAARVLQGKKVHPDVRLIVIPGTQEIYAKALQEGIIMVFIEAGAAVSTPTCGPCLGGHMGILAEGERAISTTNRNFVGRMGHPKSEVYLANPAIAAASAVLGRIGSPEELGVQP